MIVGCFAIRKQVESELWVTMHRQDILSKVFVPENDELVPFSLEAIQHLCKYFAWDVPQGFICIHIGRKNCYSVRGTQGDASTINLRCALHYLRNYAMESAGILFSPGRDGSKKRIALLQVGRSPLRDNCKHRSAPGSQSHISLFALPIHTVYVVELS